LAESVELAIERINKVNVVRMHGRSSFGRAGRVMLGSVQKAIDESDLFGCDLTHLELV
jgi:hypothetical protein